MHDTLPLLEKIRFPAIRRGRLDTLQVNVGYRCNQSCVHCHVGASPHRTEEMTGEVADVVLAFLDRRRVATLDVTGGAPELNPHFRRLVTSARDLGVRVMDRCNLTILEVPGQEDLAEFLAAQQVEIVASMPCYLEDNVDRQRGKGVFDGSVRGLKRLNALGYGRDVPIDPQSGLQPQRSIAAATAAGARNRLQARAWPAIWRTFNRLYTLANMPIQRFGSTLISKDQFESYLDMLRHAHLDANLDGVMCRNLISVDWRGFVYDCDFNQMLDLPMTRGAKDRVHLSELLRDELEGNPIRVAGHCFGCTAGQGSSCGGALKEAAE